MNRGYHYRPFTYFGAVLGVTFIAWFVAAYLSYQQGMEATQLVALLVGLAAPSVIAAIFILQNKRLRNDFIERFQFRSITFSMLAFVVTIMPSIFLCATLISLFFNYPFDQFSLATSYDVWQGHGIAFSFFFLLLAAILEEIGWRGYGIDSLQAYYTVFTTSVIFAFVWGIWHVPLCFIKGYYQYTLWHTSALYTLNFFVSLLPASILMNWVYVKSNRNILILILFHFMINTFSVAFKTEQFTKCIVTVLLFFVAAYLVQKDRVLFFEHKKDGI